MDGAYTINVDKSAEEINVYIACGDIGRVITPGDEGEDKIRAGSDRWSRAPPYAVRPVSRGAEETMVSKCSQLTGWRRRRTPGRLTSARTARIRQSLEPLSRRHSADRRGGTLGHGVAHAANGEVANRAR